MFVPNEYRTEIAQQRDSAKLFYITVNSIASYVLAYMVAYTLYQFSTAFVASSIYYIKTVVFYYRMDFRVAADYWNPARVIGTFLTGPITCLVFAIIVSRVYFYYKKQSGIPKFFFLWFYLHLYNLFFGAYVSGVITRTGFRYVTNYMAVPEKAEFAISFVCVIAMFAIGYFSTRNFLQLSASQSLIQRFSRPAYIACVVILPWLAGSAIVLISKMPKITMNEMITYLMMFTIVVPVIIVQRNFQEVNLVKQTKSVSLAWPMIIAAGVFTLLYRSVLEGGLTVGQWIQDAL